MPKCPYCSKEIFIQDFFEVHTKETKKGKVKVRLGAFKGEEVSIGFHYYKMWACPSCEAVLGFSVEYQGSYT